MKRRLRYRVRLLAAGVATIVVTGSCGDRLVGPELAVPSSIVLAPQSLRIESLSQQVDFTATVLDRQGRVIRDVPLLWTSDRPDVLRPVNGGTFLSVANGEATVQVRVDPAYPGLKQSGGATGAVAASVAVTVEQRAAAIELPALTQLWALGQREQLAAQIVDAGGHPLELPVDVAWASENAAIATVDAVGNVTAIADGTVRITASAAGLSAFATIEVSATFAYVTCLEFSLPETASPATEHCVTLTLTVTDESG